MPLNSWSHKLLLTSLLSCIIPPTASCLDITITLDDFPMAEGPIFSLEKRTDAFLEAFKKHNIKVVFFCVGDHLKTKHQFLQLNRVDHAGHFLANHSVEHAHFSEKSKDEFRNELLAMDSLLIPYQNFKRWFRFPYLDYGNRTLIGGSEEKHLDFTKVLEENKYQDGYVTINTLDWYINQKLKKAVHHGLSINYKALKRAYLKLMKQWIHEYVNLYKKQYPHETIKHSLLLHANDINALFMDDLIEMIKKEGWTIVSPEYVFDDPSWRKDKAKNLNIVNVMAPSMKPHHCNENLKPCFYSKGK